MQIEMKACVKIFILDKGNLKQIKLLAIVAYTHSYLGWGQDDHKFKFKRKSKLKLQNFYKIIIKYTDRKLFVCWKNGLRNSEPYTLKLQNQKESNYAN